MFEWRSISMIKVTHVEDTRPVKSLTVTQPKGTLDVTLSKNKAGSRIRLTNSLGDTINIANNATSLAEFKQALDKIVKCGAKAA